MKKNILLLLLAILPNQVWAQAAADNELEVIELELEKTTPSAPAPQPARPAPATSTANDDTAGKDTLSDFSGLGRLAPFSEVSIIQRRFLPKTGRFQFFIGPTVVTNDPFFNTYGGALKASYFLTETWGLEGNYFALSTSERDSTKELRSVNNVSTVNLVYPKSYMGLDLVYVPIYGKMSWFNKKIVPFDLYLSAGYGTTATSGENAGTFHLATGQIFAVTKGIAFRWDLSWNFFNATGIDGSKGSFNNLFLTVGASFFFPEAGYR